MRLFAAFALPFLAAGQGIPLDWQAVLNRINPESLRAHVTFLSSDLLEGRATPSRGLDIAASYIATHFDGAGLEPFGNNGFFHDTPAVAVRPSGDISLSVRLDGRLWRPKVAYTGDRALNYRYIPASVIVLGGKTEIGEEHRGRILIVVLPEGDVFSGLRQMGTVRNVDPALVLVADPSGSLAATGALNRPSIGEKKPSAESMIVIPDRVFAEAARRARAAEVTVQSAAAPAAKFPLRNVVAVLRGSDPGLRNTCLFVTAHYDHVGWLGESEGGGDRVFNGANDNASGVAAVLELARAMASLPRRPRRSIAFSTVSGEEVGLLGSKYLLESPPVPVANIIANINLEVLGRTDSNDGPQTGRAAVTGFRFTSIGPALAQAGKDTGIDLYRHDKYSDSFFNRSDNYSFANKGIPAHTIATAFFYPDYHGLADYASKLDYPHMAGVTRAVALAILRIADDPTPPHWNEKEAGAGEYRRKR
jgi:hypothetical protein